MDRANKRFLVAVKTLAQERLLALPVLIGGRRCRGTPGQLNDERLVRQVHSTLAGLFRDNPSPVRYHEPMCIPKATSPGR